MTLADAMRFDAELPDGSIQTFTFQNYIDYRKWLGLPVQEKEKAEHIEWLNISNMSRVSIFVALELYKRATAAGW